MDDEFVRKNEEAHNKIIRRLEEEETDHQKIIERLEKLEELVRPLKDLAATGRVGHAFMRGIIILSSFIAAILALWYAFKHGGKT